MFRCFRFNRYKNGDGKDFLRNTVSYFEYLSYRIARCSVQIADGLISLVLAPFGIETELYSNFIYYIEEKRRILWGKRYKRPVL